MKDKKPNIIARLKHNASLIYSDIDPEIRGLIKELNRLGYKTYGSCAGHLGRGEGDTGYVAFRAKFTERDKEKLRSIFKAHGLTVLDLLDEGYPGTYIDFKPIGKGIPPETELWWNTVAELRVMCRNRNLPTGGNKGYLIWRLLGL